jgi:hypothetical protein
VVGATWWHFPWDGCEGIDHTLDFIEQAHQIKAPGFIANGHAFDGDTLNRDEACGGRGVAFLA